jgi:hypothetical protein
VQQSQRILSHEAIGGDVAAVEELVGEGNALRQSLGKGGVETIPWERPSRGY